MPNETFYAITLNSACNITACKNLGKGSSNEVMVNIRELAMTALQSNSSAIILAHNHPSGILEPSIEDIEFTQSVNKLLATLRIMLLDHIIVSENEYISLAAKGFI